MQSLEIGPGSFAKILLQLQGDLEKMDKVRAGSISRATQRILNNMADTTKGQRNRDRRQRLLALLVALDDGGMDTGSDHAGEAGWLWARVHP